MASLEDRVDKGLNEARTLILGAQVLRGFNFHAVFAPSFDRLPEISRHLKLASLFSMLIAIALLIAPAAYHRIVEEGMDSGSFLRFLSIATELALLPFALGFGIDLGIAVQRVFEGRSGVAVGATALAFALFFWWGLEAWQRKRHGKDAMPKRGSQEDGKRKMPDLSERIDNVLTESRVVLPGAQALLGFQFIATLSAAFEKMARPTQVVHLASLVSIAIATIFLMTPCAWHRIVEEGENTERFHRVASRFVLAALVFLAIGMSGDVYVVCIKVLESRPVALGASAAALLLQYGLWFGFTTFRRRQKGGARRSPRRVTA